MYELFNLLGFEMSGTYDNFNGTHQQGDLELWVVFRNGFSCGVQSKDSSFSKGIIENYQITKASEVRSLLSRIDYVKQHFPRLYRKLLSFELYDLFKKLGFKIDPVEKSTFSMWWGTHQLKDGSTLWVDCRSGFLSADYRSVNFCVYQKYKGMHNNVLSPIEFENVNELLESLLRSPFFKMKTPNLYQAISQYQSESI